MTSREESPPPPPPPPPPKTSLDKNSSQTSYGYQYQQQPVHYGQSRYSIMHVGKWEFIWLLSLQNFFHKILLKTDQSLSSTFVQIPQATQQWEIHIYINSRRRRHLVAHLQWPMPWAGQIHNIHINKPVITHIKVNKKTQWHSDFDLFCWS